MADRGELTMDLERRCVTDVVEVVRPADRDACVVAEPSGISDVRAKGGELLAGLVARGVAHPVEPFDAVGERSLERGNELLDALFAVRRERASDVSLAERLTQVAIGIADTPPPARSQLARPGQRPAEHLEVLGDERAWQRFGGGMDRPPRQVCLPVVERFGDEKALERDEEVGARHQEVVRHRGADRREVCRPVERRCCRGELCERANVVGAARVAVRDGVLCGGCERGLDLEYRGRVGGCAAGRLTREAQHGPHVLEVAIALRSQARIVGHVVVATRQRQAALIDRGDDQRRVRIVLRRPEAEQRRRGSPVVAGE
jgi:hypothetical protein